MANESLIEACNVLERVESEGSSTRKITLLRNTTGDTKEVLQQLFSIALDWYRHFGIRYIPSANDRESEDKTFDDFILFIKKLEGRDHNLSPQQIANWLHSYPPVVSKWLTRVVKKDLLCGVSYKNVNKVWHNHIKYFTCQLCDVYSNGMRVGYPIAVEPKIDGVRAIAFVHHKHVKFISRSGNELFNCEDIEKEIFERTEQMEKPFILDGELYADNFRDTMSVCRTSVNSPLKELKDRMKYIVFDTMSIIDWERKVCDKPYMLRRATIHKLFQGYGSDCKVVCNSMRIAANEEELESLYREYCDLGFEGAVIKMLEARYMFNRSVTWLKYKPFFEGDFFVTDVYEGENRNEGKLGGVQIWTGKEYCNVGGGFSDDEREFYWIAPHEIIGKVVTIEYKEYTPDCRLREPVFVKVNEAQPESDV